MDRTDLSMTAYRWEAVDAQGRLRRGHLDAASARAARDRLRADGLTPTAVESAPDRGDPLPTCKPLGIEVYDVDPALLEGWRSPEPVQLSASVYA